MLTELFWMLAGGGYIIGRGLKEAAVPMRAQEYDEAHGFNKGRQLKLERMAASSDPTERMEFARLCGYTPSGYREEKMAVREISIREGWRYFDLDEVSCDPVFVKINGGKYPDYWNPVLLAREWKSVEDKAKEHIAEVDRRKAWIERCPHGEEADIFPMDYETEEDYQDAVEAWCLKRKEERIRKEKEPHYRRYAIYRTGKVRSFIAHQIDDIEFQWEKSKKYYRDTYGDKYGVKQGAAMCEWVLSMYLKTSSGVKTGFQILKEKCAMEGIDWNEVMAGTVIGDLVMKYTQ